MSAFILSTYYYSGLGQILGPAGLWSPQTERTEQREPHEDASLSQTGEPMTATMQSFEAVIISSGAEQPRAVYPGAASCEVKVERRGNVIE